MTDQCIINVFNQQLGEYKHLIGLHRDLKTDVCIFLYMLFFHLLTGSVSNRK